MYAVEVCEEPVSDDLNGARGVAEGGVYGFLSFISAAAASLVSIREEVVFGLLVARACRLICGVWVVVVNVCVVNYKNMSYYFIRQSTNDLPSSHESGSYSLGPPCCVSELGHDAVVHLPHL